MGLCPHGVPCPFGSFLSDRWRQPDFEDRKRARQKLPSLMAENGNACTTCAYLSPTPGFFAPFYYCQCLCPDRQRCSDTNDGLFERRVVSVCNAYLHILCMIEPGKDIRFSSSVKHLHNLHNMHLSRRLHRSTSDGLLMVAQRKGALNIHCILARFMHIWDQHVHAPELYCLTFGAEPASGLGQSSTADQPCRRTAAISHELQNVLSHELQNGPCRKTRNGNIWNFSLSFVSCRIRCGSQITLLVRKRL